MTNHLTGASIDYRSRTGSRCPGSFLAEQLGRRYGSTHAELAELVQSAARLALECIGTSDALYHDVEHTMLATFAGYDVIRGRALLKPTHASDFAHFIVACLFHDIGYVRGTSKATASTVV